ncbi:MAG TPA: prenyltransferase/squalene oxidase repeat-containing protein [Candidatus Saccharimonadales bacterium]|nr:prenyltransferase/squalene oxidase repeat-containing protein [Candidatus Saccharimonadales bacterium]
MVLKSRKIKARLGTWLLLAAALGPISLPAQQLYTGSASLVAEEVDHMYVKAMQFLVRTQGPQGNWPDQPIQTQAALTGLAVLSLLAHGDDPNFGPYSTTIHRGLDFILKTADPATGYIGPTMYNHGFATLALAESYGAVEDARLGPALQKAVKVIITAQEQNNFHAWRYSPAAKDADTTVSGAQMVALLAARNAGMPVPEQAIQDGLKFFLTCQMPNGGIGYISPVGPNATRTAIACVVFALAKQKNSEHFAAAFAFLKQAPPDTQYPPYFLYYVSQAYFHGSPELWQSWNRENIKSLRAIQAPEGNWDGQFGTTFSTAGSLLSLALNYRYLPIYER